MAKMVMGIGSSHSPTLLMEPRAWLARGERDDRLRHALYDRAGTRVQYDELLADASPTLLAEIEPERLEERRRANNKAMDRVAELLVQAAPDIVIIIGDDHKEVYQDDNMPALAVYWGETFPYKPQAIMKWNYAADLRSELWYPQEERTIPSPLNSHGA